MGLFSFFSRGPSVTAKDRAILDLKRQRDKIKQYQKRIEGVRSREHALAKKCLAKGDRNKALLFLRKEKFQEKLLSRIDEQLASLEELVSSIEFAQIQRDVVFGLEQGAKVLREVNAEMSIEKIEKIMDDSAEGIAYQQEVQQILSERITASDDEEVEAELRAMEREAKPQMAQEDAVPRTNKLPSVPSTKIEDQRISKAGKEEEEEDQKQASTPMLAS